ncbi:hypothetical protein [Schlesneria sp. T3-172]|uniref:hypothetical protein n=1 Tax=Schlesneria sphaerica TaxID=3373610 RepID=UPI0037CC5E69
MPALTIDLNDQATEGLEQLNATLEQTAESAEIAAEGAEALTDAQLEQQAAIEDTQASWLKLATTSATALAKIGKAGLDAYDEIKGAAESAIKATRLLGDEDSLAERAAFFAAERAGWKAVAVAAEVTGSAAFRYATGIGTALIAAKVGWMGVSAILDRTGKQTVELADGTTKIQTNLDRVNESVGEFGHTVGRTMSEAGSSVVAVASELLHLPEIWKQIDAAATQATEQMVAGTNLATKAYDESTLALRQFYVEMTEGGGEAYRKEIESLRKLSDWHAKMDVQRGKEKEHFERIRGIHQQAEDRANARAEAQRIASIKTTEAIDSEIQKIKEQMGAQGTNLEFTAEESKRVNDLMISLEKRRADIVAETSKAIADARKKEADEFQQQQKEYQKLVDEQAKSATELHDLEMKRAAEKAGFSRDLDAAERNQAAQAALESAKDQSEAQKELVTDRLKSQGATEEQIKRRMAEMDIELAAEIHTAKAEQMHDELSQKMADIDRQKAELDRSNDSEVEYNKKLIKLKSDADRLFFETNKRWLEERGRFEREQDAITAKHKLAQQQAVLAAEQEQREKAKALQNEALQKAFPVNDVLNSTDPRKVLQQLQANRSLQEQQAQAERDSALGQQAMAGDKASIAKWNRNQQAAMNRGRNSANRDFENGNLNENEVVQAQAEVAQQSLAGLQQQQRISEQTAQALGEVMNTLAQEAARANALQQSVEQLTAVARGMKQGARRGADSARSQIGSLN